MIPGSLGNLVISTQKDIKAKEEKRMNQTLPPHFIWGTTATTAVTAWTNAKQLVDLGHAILLEDAHELRQLLVRQTTLPHRVHWETAKVTHTIGGTVIHVWAAESRGRHGAKHCSRTARVTKVVRAIAKNGRVVLRVGSVLGHGRWGLVEPLRRLVLMLLIVLMNLLMVPLVLLRMRRQRRDCKNRSLWRPLGRGVPLRGLRRLRGEFDSRRAWGHCPCLVGHGRALVAHDGSVMDRSRVGKVNSRGQRIVRLSVATIA